MGAVRLLRDDLFVSVLDTCLDQTSGERKRSLSHSYALSRKSTCSVQKRGRPILKNGRFITWPGLAVETGRVLFRGEQQAVAPHLQ